MSHDMCHIIFANFDFLIGYLADELELCEAESGLVANSIFDNQNIVNILNSK